MHYLQGGEGIISMFIMFSNKVIIMSEDFLLHSLKMLLFNSNSNNQKNNDIFLRTTSKVCFKFISWEEKAE